MSEKIPLVPPQAEPAPQAPELIDIDPDSPLYAQIEQDALRRLRPDLVGLQWHQYGRRFEVSDHEILVTEREKVEYGLGRDKIGVWGIHNKEKSRQKHEELVNQWAVKTYDANGNVINVSSYEGRELADHLDKQSRDTTVANRITGFQWNEAPDRSKPVIDHEVEVRLKPGESPFKTIMDQKKRMGLKSLAGLTWHNGESTLQVAEELTITHNVRGEKRPVIAWVVKTRDKHGRLTGKDTYVGDDLRNYFEEKATLSKVPALKLHWEISSQKPEIPVLDDKAKLWAGWIATWGPSASKDALNVGNRGVNPTEYVPDFILPNRGSWAVTEDNWAQRSAEGLLPVDKKYLGFIEYYYGVQNVFTGDAYDPKTGKPVKYRPGDGVYLHPDALEWDRRMSSSRALELLSYRDVLEGKEAKDMAEAVLNHPQAREYVTELQKIVNEMGQVATLEMAAELRSRCLDALDRLSVPATKQTESLSWALWDLARQSFYASNPDKVDSKYLNDDQGVKVGSPFGDTAMAKRKQQEIINQQLGRNFEEAAVHYGEQPVIEDHKVVGWTTQLLHNRKQVMLPNGAPEIIDVVSYDRAVLNKLPALIKKRMLQIILNGQRDETDHLRATELVHIGELLQELLHETPRKAQTAARGSASAALHNSSWGPSRRKTGTESSSTVSADATANVDSEVEKLRRQGMGDRAIYRRLAKRYHPDTNNGPAASEEFIVVSNRLEDLNREDGRRLKGQQ